MTPIALLYLFVIDIIFMIFALLSTFWLLLVLLILCMCGVDPHKAVNHDIRDCIDDKVFAGWLNMNRTEIVGYRRLRTLSQLFFETMPQIVLQLRILWVIEWSGDKNNTFQIDLKTLGWSIGLAFAHLILEGGIIYLDKSAFKMSFLEYSLECLGGRVTWIPFQHLLSNIIENQLYIFHDGDRTNFSKQTIDAQSYHIHLNYMQFEDLVKNQQLLFLDYEEISANMNCFVYTTSYQFSPQSISKFIEMITNCPAMAVPLDFKLSTTNVPLQDLLKQALIVARIKLGRHSFGSVDIRSFCKLYTACFQKIRLDTTNEQIIQRVLRTDKRNNATRRDILKMIQNENKEHKVDDIDIEKQPNKTTNKEIANYIKQRLLLSGDAETISWICKTLSDEEIADVKLFILIDAIAANSTEDNIRLDVLKNCSENNFYLGYSCRGMTEIELTIEKCYRKCKQDQTWYFVILFILFYSRGRIFGVGCINGCCELNPTIKKDLLSQWVPHLVQIGKSKVPFEVFENCASYPVYKSLIEETLINNCKNYIIAKDKSRNTEPVVLSVEHVFDIAHTCKDWNYLKGQKEDVKAETINDFMHKLYKKQFYLEHIALLDELMFDLHINTAYNQYLYETLKFRDTSQVPNIESKEETKHSFTMNKLLAVNDVKERYQISEMKFEISGTEHDILNCKIYFSNTLLFSWTAQNKDDEPEVKAENKSNDADHADTVIINDANKLNNLVIDANNVALGTYNNYLLHFKADTGIPPIIVETSDICNVTINIKYVKLFREKDQKRLNDEHIKAIKEKQTRIRKEEEERKRRADEERRKDTERAYQKLKRAQISEMDK
eukprot:360368_1